MSRDSLFKNASVFPPCSAVTVATGLMAVHDAFGPRPLVLPFRCGVVVPHIMVVLHIPWMVALVLSVEVEYLRMPKPALIGVGDYSHSTLPSPGI